MAPPTVPFQPLACQTGRVALIPWCLSLAFVQTEAGGKASVSSFTAFSIALGIEDSQVVSVSSVNRCWKEKNLIQVLLVTFTRRLEGDNLFVARFYAVLTVL